MTAAPASRPTFAQLYPEAIEAAERALGADATDEAVTTMAVELTTIYMMQTAPVADCPEIEQ